MLPSIHNTRSLAGAVIISEPCGGLVTVLGGKWTMYRLMAQDAVDAAVQAGRLPADTWHCRTHALKLVGAQSFSKNLHVEVGGQTTRVPEVCGLAQNLHVEVCGLAHNLHVEVCGLAQNLHVEVGGLVSSFLLVEVSVLANNSTHDARRTVACRQQHA